MQNNAHFLDQLDENKHLPSGQCTSPQSCFGNGTIWGYEVRIVKTSTSFIGRSKSIGRK